MAFFEFPHTRTYDSDLAWLIKAYKILTGKVNNIEQTIEDTINDALQGEELKQLITQMMAEALPLNVKYPPAESGLTPAVGDGETDDTAALQDMIAYANANNMPMIFPAGVYRVTGLDVNVDTVFQGFDATLMLAPVSAKPLITLTANLATSGLTLNGNLGGQTTAQNVINIVNGSFAITNSTIMGGESCIEGTLVGDSIIGDSYLQNFQEYGIHAEGNGSFTASNVVVPSVASSGAMRFIRIDCDNCTISNFSSKASVPIGFEITGDNNTITAIIPNVETPVNDGGQNNNWEIVGKSEKRIFNGTAYHQYENIQEKVSGDKTEEIGDKNQTITNYKQNVNIFTGEAENKYKFSGKDIILNPTNPLTYKTPEILNDYFNSVKMKDNNEEIYDVLVPGEKFNEIGSGTEQYINVKKQGAVGDGINNDLNAIISACNLQKINHKPIYFPAGTYLINGTIPAYDNMTFIGEPQKQATIKQTQGTNMPIIETQNTQEGQETSNMFFSNLIFDMDTTRTETSGTHCLRILGCKNFTAFNCIFKNASGYGIGFQGRPDSDNPLYTGTQRNVLLLYCRFQNNGFNTTDDGDGVDFKSGINVIIHGCEASGNKDNGFDLRGSNYRVSDCYSHDNLGAGISVRCTTSNTFIADYEITNCRTSNNGTNEIGISCEANTSASTTGSMYCTISNVTMQNKTAGVNCISILGKSVEYITIINLNNIIIIGNRGINISGFSSSNLRMQTININFRGSGASQVGIANNSQNLVLTGFRIVSNNYGYLGNTNSTGTVCALFENRATSPYENVQPTILYPIFPSL